MDRTEDFRRLSGIDPAAESRKELFYVTFSNRISFVTNKLANATTYRAVFSAEEEFAQLQKDITGILSAIELAGPADLQHHYAGIKAILAQKLVATGKLLQNTKNKINAVDLDIAPERPTRFRETTHQTGSQLLERENKRITTNQEYEVAQAHLHRIESVQKAINENLVLQEERIDSICTTTGQTTEVYKNLSEGDDFEAGSFLRRALLIILLCLSFVLLFIHWFGR